MTTELRGRSVQITYNSYDVLCCAAEALGVQPDALADQCIQERLMQMFPNIREVADQIKADAKKTRESRLGAAVEKLRVGVDMKEPLP